MTETPKEEFQNLMLKCYDCSHDFVWTEGEQKFFKDRGLARPKRCPQCRFRRRQQSQGDVRILDGNPEPAEIVKPSKKEDKTK